MALHEGVKCGTITLGRARNQNRFVHRLAESAAVFRP
jgi:hypothetical protein